MTVGDISWPSKDQMMPPNLTDEAGSWILWRAIAELHWHSLSGCANVPILFPQRGSSVCQYNAKNGTFPIVSYLNPGGRGYMQLKVCLNIPFGAPCMYTDPFQRESKLDLGFLHDGNRTEYNRIGQ